MQRSCYAAHDSKAVSKVLHANTDDTIPSCYIHTVTLRVSGRVLGFSVLSGRQLTYRVAITSEG